MTHLIQQWMNEGVNKGERLELARCLLIEYLNECDGDTSAALRLRVRSATTLQQIEALRVGIFNQIARCRHQQKAVEAIRLLDKLVLTREKSLSPDPVRPQKQQDGR